MSLSAQLARADERHPYRVMSFRQWCELVGISDDTGRRIIASGNGPRITQLSERRIGVREDHHVAWLDGRVK